MKGRIIISLLVLFSFTLTTESGVVTQSYGTADNFDYDSNNREYFPTTTELTTCTNLDWTGISSYTGDSKPPAAYEFDKTIQNLANIMTLSNLPPQFTNPRLHLRIKGTGDRSDNDGFGFFWNDNIPTTGGQCTAAFFKTFSSYPDYSSYDEGSNIQLEISLDGLTFKDSQETLLSRIQQQGYFHFFVGDDTSIDYFRFIFDTDYDVDQIVSFTCNTYTSGEATIATGQNCHTDSTLSITTIDDSETKPFSGSLLLQTYSGDKSSSQSVFKVHLSDPLRFWVFLAQSDVPHTTWLTEAGYTKLTDGSITTSDGTIYIPYTKRYDGNRWVVFGNPSTDTTQSNQMYFVSFSLAASIVTIPPNPSSSCDCESTGDPHYVTWDNRRYDFYEPGVYHLVKARDCTFDVQSLTFKYGSTVTVNGIVGVRYLSDVVTCSRTPPSSSSSSSKSLWTGNLDCRANGELISETTQVDVDGHLNAIKDNANQWRVQLSSVGLEVKMVASGNWYHVYVSLADPDYQRTVDGLCGNCDGDGTNDFKYPNCDEAISSSSSSKLSYTQTIQWGTSWKVSTNEEFAQTSKLNDTTIGTTTSSVCTNQPIRQYCPDLVPPEVPPPTDDDDDVPPTIIEPLPPTDFFTCDEGVVINIVDQQIPPPPTDEPTPTPPTPCNKDRYESIVSKCLECADSNRYDPESCITDLCESGQDLHTYQCPGSNKCVQASEPTNTVTQGSYEWAMLDDSSVEGTPNEDFCDSIYYLPPSGWEVSPMTDDGEIVSTTNPWSTYCVALGDSSVRSSYQSDQEGNCPTKGTIVKTTDGCYIANNCNTKILIRKPLLPECGNGILEGDELCDDGNVDDGDGCTSSCTTEDTHFCISTVTPNLCSSVSNVVEEEYHDCLLGDWMECSGCVKNDENRHMASCCDCSFACCE